MEIRVSVGAVQYRGEVLLVLKYQLMKGHFRSRRVISQCQSKVSRFNYIQMVTHAAGLSRTDASDADDIQNSDHFASIHRRKDILLSSTSFIKGQYQLLTVLQALDKRRWFIKIRLANNDNRRRAFFIREKSELIDHALVKGCQRKLSGRPQEKYQSWLISNLSDYTVTPTTPRAP